MSGYELLGAVTAVWAVAMAVSPVLQIRQMLRTGGSDEVSIGYFGVLVVGFTLWCAYGISRDDYVVAVPNSIAAVVAVATIIVALRLRRRAVAAVDEDS